MPCGLMRVRPRCVDCSLDLVPRKTCGSIHGHPFNRINIEVCLGLMLRPSSFTFMTNN
jgi:hypothetical protein